MMAKPKSIDWRSPASLGMIAAVAGCAVCTATLFWFDPEHSSFYPGCMFHRLTGWNCPGCGSLRALHQFSHGHLLAALRDNPLLIGSLPFIGFFFLRELRRWLAGQPMTFPAVRPRQMLIFAGVLVGFTIIRNIPAAPFIYLSPP